MSDPDLYVYRMKVISIYDGDTISSAVFDLGFGQRFKVGPREPVSGVRLFGVDTPEIRGKSPWESAKALEALDHMLLACPLGEWTFVRSYKDRSGKFGRILAEVWPQGVPITRPTVNQELIELGLGVPYSGRGEKWRDVYSEECAGE